MLFFSLEFMIVLSAESDWPVQGITMCQNSGDQNQQDIGTFHTSYDVVFIDPTGYHNLCSHMLESTYYRVKNILTMPS